MDSKLRHIACQLERYVSSITDSQPQVRTSYQKQLLLAFPCYSQDNLAQVVSLRLDANNFRVQSHLPQLALDLVMVNGIHDNNNVWLVRT